MVSNPIQVRGNLAETTIPWLEGPDSCEQVCREPRSHALGILKEPMRFPESGIFEARISTDCAMVEGKWIGPTTR